MKRKSNRHVTEICDDMVADMLERGILDVHFKKVNGENIAQRKKKRRPLTFEERVKVMEYVIRRKEPKRFVPAVLPPLPGKPSTVNDAIVENARRRFNFGSNGKSE